MNIMRSFLKNLREFKHYAGNQLGALGRRLTRDEFPAVVDFEIADAPEPRERPVFVHIEMRLGLALAPGVSVQEAVSELEYSINTPIELGDVVDSEITELREHD
jgi:hypothetical protein